MSIDIRMHLFTLLPIQKLFIFLEWDEGKSELPKATQRGAHWKIAKHSHYLVPQFQSILILSIKEMLPIQEYDGEVAQSRGLGKLQNYKCNSKTKILVRIISMDSIHATQVTCNS